MTSFPVGGDGGWDYLTVDAAIPARLRLPGDSRRGRRRRFRQGRGRHPGDGGGPRHRARARAEEGLHEQRARGNRHRVRPRLARRTATIKATGENPDAILYEPVSKRVFTFNGRGKNVTAIDAASGAVVGTLPVGGKPEFAVSDAAGVVYVNIEDTAEVVAFDAKSLAVKGRWKLASCEEPTGLALDPKAKRLFAGCSGNKTLSIMSAADGKAIGTAPIGDGCDGVAFDPSTGLVFASNGEGTLTVLRETAPGTYGAVETVPTKKSARTLALDPATHRILLPAARFEPPPSPSPDNPRPRPVAVAGSFEILVVGAR